MADTLPLTAGTGGFDLVQAADQWIQPLMVLDREFRFVYANRAYLRIMGKAWKDLNARYFFDVFYHEPKKRAEVEEAFRSTFDGELTYLAEHPYELEHPDGSIHVRTWQWVQKPFRGAEGIVTHIVQRCEDVTDRVELKRQNEIMSNELAHRIKNMFSVIMATARISGSVASDLDGFIDEFNDRLVSMSRVYSKLTTNDWYGLPLRHLLEEEIRAVTRRDDSRYCLSGPDITLSLKSTKDGALIIHELASNASKYGCFSQPDGRLDVTWYIEDEHLVVVWEESDLTGVRPPSRKGFGSILFHMLPNLKVTRDFRDTGLVLTVRSPISISIFDDA
ncbi:sensor histidine kinase [Hyphomonas pacifica]|uniref:histidine kinase n=1 Tax=Hyphomonas pacifica TaxID=1280941 RepID=A0A062TU96_9PROT|nr:HWE histidine kinase domain-containing protein [Hyphomonas pacifica]KCZ51556.1 hypothetical protein HY2_11145 [Hyphomonas pacifica]RAN34104.1 hypothetical protein HY3_11095 [Hyphomonas pacifica]RAN35884.1 hypothetical protein HY11_12945 [Hyphomonas pacifica]